MDIKSKTRSAARRNARAAGRRRLMLSMLAVILPGLVISGLGIRYVSQQRKARELKLQEKYQTTLTQIRGDTEERLEQAIEKACMEISGANKTLFSGNPATLRNTLKKLLLGNPVVKYPFIIDAHGTFVFPFSEKAVIKNGTAVTGQEEFYLNYAQKKSRFYRTYKKGEDLEFKERDFAAAVVYYLDALEQIKEKRIKRYVSHAIARCYYKLNRFPQALAYLRETREEFGDNWGNDESLYFRVLHLTARAYRQMDIPNKALDFYLLLYDKILQYEMSRHRTTFTFFKNEALDYLNRHIKENRGGRVLVRAGGKEDEETMSDLDFELQWQYVDPDAAETALDEGKNDEAFRFDRIREFYLPNDVKTLFYKVVKNLRFWAGPAGSQPAVKTLTGLRLRDRPDIAYIPVGSGNPGEPRLFFGFMISLEFIRTRLLPAAAQNRLDEATAVFIGSKDTPAVFPYFRFPLMRVSFSKFLPTRELVLAADRAGYIETTVKKDMWFNYGLIAVIISLLILGAWFFYKYNAREAELLRLKSDFVDAASHTLKTPLTRIRMMAEKMELGWVKDEEKKKEYFKAILAETDGMAEMISSMLDFSRVESGKKNYDMRSADLAGHIRAVMQLLSPHIDAAGFQLETQLADNIPPFYFAPEAVRLILTNLVRNALKYADMEKYIAVKLFRRDHDAVIEVSDRGRGIPQKYREKIFEQFFRVPDEHVKAKEGSGLGLFLVRHAVEAHNGRITVESEPGKGSTFTVSLPIENSVSPLRHEGTKVDK